MLVLPTCVLHDVKMTAVTVSVIVFIVVPVTVVLVVSIVLHFMCWLGQLE